MPPRILSPGLILVALCSSAGNAAPPIARAVASKSPCLDATPPIPSDVAGVFGYNLRSAKVLHFIAALARAPEAQQKPLVKAAVAVAGSPAQTQLKALADACPILDALVAEPRVVAFVDEEWTTEGLGSDTDLQAFTNVVANALWVLASDQVSPEVERTALEPFAILGADIELPALASTAGTCPDAEPQTIHAVDPTYPAIAVATHLTGSLQIEVAINEFGDVANARVFKTSLADQPGAAGITNAAILAAAASTYAAATSHCVPVVSNAIFIADFDPPAR